MRTRISRNERSGRSVKVTDQRVRQICSYSLMVIEAEPSGCSAELTSRGRLVVQAWASG